MKITKNMINNYNEQLVLECENNNKFMINYAGGDLYWTMIDYCSDNKFLITKNDGVFFLELENLFCKLNGNYYELINNNCFEWVSEAYGILEDANKLFIVKEDDKFIIRFYLNPNRAFSRKDICAICFCLSGSKYQEIANEFSIMFYKCISSIKSKTRVLK